MVRALERLPPPATLHHLVAAMTADVDERAQLLVAAAHDGDGRLARATGEERARLGHLLEHARVLPGSPEDPVQLELVDGRIRVVRRGQRHPALELFARRR